MLRHAMFGCDLLVAGGPGYSGSTTTRRDKLVDLAKRQVLDVPRRIKWTPTKIAACRASAVEIVAA
jgi:hypothetical protein